MSSLKHDDKNEPLHFLMSSVQFPLVYSAVEVSVWISGLRPCCHYEYLVQDGQRIVLTLSDYGNRNVVTELILYDLEEIQAVLGRESDSLNLSANLSLA